MTDNLVSDTLEENIISELPCTLAIEDSMEDSTEASAADEVCLYPAVTKSNRWFLMHDLH